MRNDSKSPRKKPVQERSVDLVNSVFKASVRILKSVGIAKFTTRSVAEIAGISVGSLYQYFPNKEALVGALIEREAKRHVEILEIKFAEIQHLPFSTAILILISEILKTIKKDKSLLKVILSSTFVVERLDSIIDARECLVNFVEKVLAHQPYQLSIPNPKLKAYTIVAALGGLVETIIFQKKEPFTEDELTNEVSAMIVSFCRL